MTRQLEDDEKVGYLTNKLEVVTKKVGKAGGQGPMHIFSSHLIPT